MRVATRCSASATSWRRRSVRSPTDMAVLDVAGFVADLKDDAVEHGFHVHDERHFVESYSLRQTWEVDLHPEEGCEGPVDLYLSLEIDPRVLLGFEDAVIEVGDEAEPDDAFHFPLSFTWALPPLAHGPDLLVLATDLAGVGGRDLPLDVSATDSFPAATDARWNCPTDCPRYERRKIDAGWQYGSLAKGMEPAPPEPEVAVSADVAALLDEAENIVNAAGVDLFAEQAKRDARRKGMFRK